MSDRLAVRAGTAVLWKGGQMIASRLIALVRLLVLARLLVPEDFGLLAIGLTVVQTILAITDFGMVPALVQHPEPVRRHYDAAWTIGVSRALIIAAVIFAAAPWIALLYAEPAATPIIQLLALKPLLEALNSIKLAELTRRLDFRSLAIFGLVPVIVDTAVSIALAPRLGVWALVSGVLAGAATGLTISYFIAPYRPRLRFERAAARPLIRYGRWVFLTGIFAVAGSFFLQIAIARQLGAGSLGVYYLGVKLAFLFSEVAAEVIGAVAFPVYARLQHDLTESARAFRAVLVGMATLLMPAYGLLIALTPVLEGTLLSAKWEGTAPVIQVLAAVGLLGLFGDMVVPVFKGLGQPYRVAALEVVQSALIIALAWTLAGAYELIGAALAWLPAIVVSQLVSGWMVQRLLPKPFAGVWRPLGGIFLVAVLGAIAALAITWLLPGLSGLAAGALLAGGGMAGGLFMLDRLWRLGLLDNLVRTFPQVQKIYRFVRVSR